MDILGKCSRCKKTVNLSINIKTNLYYKQCKETSKESYQK